MTEDQDRLLAVFEVRVRDLLALCEARRQRIIELEAALDTVKAEDRDKGRWIDELRAKCDNMLTMQIVSAGEQDVKNARVRLLKLVREVDKCIALLNE